MVLTGMRLLMPITYSANPDALVVVFIHWGNEYECPTVPRKVGAGDSTDAARLIIGAHPHVVQDVGIQRCAYLLLLGILFLINIFQKYTRGISGLIDIVDGHITFEKKTYKNRPCSRPYFGINKLCYYLQMSINKNQ